MYNFSKDKAEEIYGAAKELVPVLPKDDLTKLIVKQAIEQLNTASKTVEELRTLMNETASKLPEYPVVMEMKGVGPSLGLSLWLKSEMLHALPIKELSPHLPVWIQA